MSTLTPTLEQLNQESRRKLAPFQAKFPQLFAKLEWLETGDGWDKLIEYMCIVIQEYIEYKIPEELREQVYFTQIKQKFGFLRIHMSQQIPYIQGVITMADAMSGSICEKCGQTGSVRNVGNWLTTLCDKHYEEANKGK
jgi:hypothetical protein